MKFPSGLKRKMEARASRGTLRSLSLKKEGVDFCSNDYLGFSRSGFLKDVIGEDEEQRDYPSGSTGSRLISGNYEVHEQLEKELAGHFGASSALLFNSGYDANVGLLSAILQRHDRIFYDQLSHASIRDGINMTPSRAYGFKHNDLHDLRKKINNAPQEGGHTYVVVESIYSMDGDRAPLEALADLCEKEGLYLIVDEAHATGVTGPRGKGLISALGLEKKVFARVHTFGKALGCHGAAVLGEIELRNYLINFSRSFIYTTALPPMEAVKVSKALKLLNSTEAMEKLEQNIEFFNQYVEALGIGHCFLESKSPIQSFMLKNVKDWTKLEQDLEQKGFATKSIKAPTVPEGEERIRICLHSYNTSEQIQRILYLLSTFV